MGKNTVWMEASLYICRGVDCLVEVLGNYHFLYIPYKILKIISWHNARNLKYNEMISMRKNTIKC